MGRFDEVRLQRFTQLQQRLLGMFISAHRQHLQERLGQVHLWVLQRAAAQVSPVFAQAGLVQAVVTGELLVDDAQRSVQG
ncbi:hypothetical protein D3C81_2084590 [compost metagenome]